MQFYLFIFLSKLLLKQYLITWAGKLAVLKRGTLPFPLWCHQFSRVFKRMRLGWSLWQIAINCELTALHSLREGKRPKPSSCSLQPFPSPCAGSLEVHFSAASEGIASYSWSHALFSPSCLSTPALCLLAFLAQRIVSFEVNDLCFLHLEGMILRHCTYINI